MKRNKEVQRVKLTKEEYEILRDLIFKFSLDMEIQSWYSNKKDKKEIKKMIKICNGLLDKMDLKN